MAVDGHFPVATAAMAVESVGVSDRHGGYQAWAGKHAATSVAHGLGLFPVAQGDDYGAQGGYGPQGGFGAVVQHRYAIESDSESHHIELVLGETQYAGGVQHMAKHLVWEVADDQVGAAGVIVELTAGVVVLVEAVGGGKVGEHRFHSHLSLAVELLEQTGQLLFAESEPVHAGIEF